MYRITHQQKNSTVVQFVFEIITSKSKTIHLTKMLVEIVTNKKTNTLTFVYALMI